MNRFFSILYNFLTYITAYGEIDFMNSTGVVGYIALLMICGSILGGDGQVNFWSLRADAMSSNSILHSTREPISIAVNRSGPKGERYVRIFIDGIPYEGTLHANSIDKKFDR